MPEPQQPSMPDSIEVPRLRRGLAPLAGLLIAVVLVMAGLAIWGARQHALTQIRQTSDNLGLMLAEQVSRTLQAVDLILQATAEQIRNDGIDSPSQFRGEMDNQHVHDALV